MAWERGAWEKTTSMSGYIPSRTNKVSKVTSNKPSNKNIKKVSSKRANLIRCPICNKEQAYLRDKCINCGHVFSHFRKNQKYIEEFKNDGFNINTNKQNQYSKNTFFKAPFILLNSNSLVSKSVELINSKPNGMVLFVSIDDGINKKIQKQLNIDYPNSVIITEDMENNYLKGVIEDINEFKRISNSLVNKYSLKKFNNLKSVDNIGEFKILNENVHYIDKKDGLLLNEFIKLYWDYIQLLEENDINLDDANQNIENQITAQSKDLLSLKQSIIWIKSNMTKLEKIYDLLGISDLNLNEKIHFLNNLSMLNHNPDLVDVDESKKFIDVLKEYQKINTFNRLSNDFKKENHVINEVIYNYQKVINCN